jgi:arabinofuranosyltransferase
MSNSSKAIILTRSKTTITLIVIFVILFIAIVISNAWVSEDAYITFRTVDNFIHGYGPTWNTDERVQTYTHPLWMLLLAVIYFFTREIFYSSIGLSVIISLATVLLLAFALARSTPLAILGLMILSFSKAFVDYSTSGLENPLTHLIWITFLLVYFNFKNNLKSLFYLSLLAALGALNRMDTFLLFAPALGYAWVVIQRTKFNLRPFQVVIAGFAPLILWECFALFYYGFPFPNTAYAKLYTGLHNLTLIWEGLYYFLDSLWIDHLTLLVIISGIIVTIARRKWRYSLIAAGIVLYLLYVVKIGGDYMSGRYLTAPLLGAVALLITQDSLYPSQFTFRRAQFTLSHLWLPLVIIVLLIGLSSPYPPLFNSPDYQLKQSPITNKVLDERGHHAQYSSLLNTHLLDQPWVIDGLEARAQGTPVYIGEGIGYLGFYAGPAVHIVDVYALSDPLLARLPPILDEHWLSGHFRRRLPEGYYDTLLLKQNKLKNADLAAYYDKLALVTRGELFDVARLIEIWNLNLGKYDHFLAAYPYMFQVDLSTAAQTPAVALWSRSVNLAEYAGLQINLNQIYHHRRLEISLLSNNDYPPEEMQSNKRAYRLVYFMGDWATGEDVLEIPVIAQNILYVDDIPADAAAKGYDTIKIFPAQGNYLNNILRSIKSVQLIE